MERSATDQDPDRSGVPFGLQAAAGWSWRLIVVGAGVYLLFQALSMFELLVVPVLVALLLGALLRPLVDLTSRGRGRPGLPRGLAAGLAVLFALVVVAGLFTLVGQRVSTGFPSLAQQAQQGWQRIQDDLASGPLYLSDNQVGSWVDNGLTSLRANSGRLVTGAIKVGTTVTDIASGFFIAMFATFFFLYQGDSIWAWLVRLFPREARPKVDGAGVRAWATLTAYVRATVIVAATDGLGVALVALGLGVPLAIPLGVLVFLGAFVPIIGSLVSGSVAVLVALVTLGPLKALLMLAGVIAVQQLESHVLQPFLMGHAVRVHPLAVILSIGAGVLVAGVVGALFAVPLAAVINVVGSYLAGTEPATEAPPDGEGPQPPGTAGDLAQESPQESPGESSQESPGELAGSRAVEPGPPADVPEDHG